MATTIPTEMPDVDLNDIGSGADILDQPIMDTLEAGHWLFQHSGLAVSGQVFDPNWSTTSTGYTQANDSGSDYAADMHNAFSVQPNRDVQDGSDNARIAIALSATLANCRLKATFYGSGGTFTVTVEELGAAFSNQNDYVLIDPADLAVSAFTSCYVVVEGQVPSAGTARVASYSLVAGLIPASELPRGR